MAGRAGLSQRQKEILDLIVTEGPQYIDQLSLRFGVTTQTIRRDINAMCDTGHARRFHGGVDVPVESGNISINARASLNSAAKRAIGQEVAKAIEPGATVFMGIGSTVHYVAEALRDHSSLRVVTNNLDVAMTFADSPQIEVHLSGGQFRHNDRDVVGADAVKFFEKFYASYAVIGAGALDPSKGVLDFSQSEAEMTSTLIANSRVQFLAADASKWSKGASVRVVPFGQITTIFTDEMPSDEPAQDALSEAKVKVVLCG